MISFLALTGALLAIAIVVIYTLRSGAPPTPSGARSRTAMLNLAFAHVPTPGTIYDLGAGWGGLAAAAARRVPNHRVVGWEISPLPWLIAVVLRRITGPTNLSFSRGDFMNADLSDAACVLCYLHRPLMEQLAPKLLAELRPGTIVVSNFFELPGWQPVQIVRADDLYLSPIYLYRVPLQ